MSTFQPLRPGRDVRSDLPPPVLRETMLTFDELVPGAQLQGTVRNVVDFGSFVDIGIGTAALLPGTRKKVGQVISVVVVRKEGRHRVNVELAPSKQ